MGYEWFKLASLAALPFAMPERSPRASQHQMDAFFENLVRELDRVEFLRPAEKRDTMLVNLRNIFSRRAARGRPKGVCSIASRQQGSGRCWPSTARRRRRMTPAARCGGWRGSCGEIRPTPSACCGSP